MASTYQTASYAPSRALVPCSQSSCCMQTDLSISPYHCTFGVRRIFVSRGSAMTLPVHIHFVATAINPLTEPLAYFRVGADHLQVSVSI
jgi:hypothetical protein